MNWFRKDGEGRWLWPGYGENSRVLKWIFECAEGRAEAVETPIGRLPAPGALDFSGLELTPEDEQALLGVDRAGWLAEADGIEEFYATIGQRLPSRLTDELLALRQRLG